MPLRQTILNFYKSRQSIDAPMAAELPRTRPSLVRNASSSPSENDPDTIVVSPARQLPSPSESSLDVSVQGILEAKALTMKQVPKGRAQRVSRRLNKSVSQDALVGAEGAEEEDEALKNRNVSGETLVNMDNDSQMTLVKDSIKALDLPWDLNNIEKGAAEADLNSDTVMVEPAHDDHDEEDEEEQRLRTEKAAAKKAKMEENNRKWEQKRKHAEKSATRRSSRLPVLDKAADMVSSLASSVLGKRKDRTSELKASERQSSAAAVSQEPSPKKRRTDDNPPEEDTIIHKNFRRQKRWLISGLYAGQTRPVDGRPADSKNKRKTPQEPEEPIKENRVLPLPMYAGERLLQNGRDFKLPYDIFSPLPPGQPKPDEWRKVNKSVFVGDAAQFWRTSKFEEHSACMCTRENGCDQNCMNRYMYYECDSKNCNLPVNLCGNRAFDDLLQRTKKGGKYNVGVEVIKTADRGYGVRSNRSFEPNQAIVEYTGEIITQEECEHRMRTMYKNNECYYLMLFDQNMIIDATRGSIARFVNHSCAPNCRMEKWTVNGKPRMALFAGENGIMTGDELTYDYNFDPYSQKNVQECRCGAPNCRGFLGPKPKHTAAKKETSPPDERRKGGKLAGAKRKLTEIVEERTTKISKKAKVTGPKAKAKVYRGAKAASPLRVKKVKMIKKVVSRKTSATTSITGLVRRPSKMKKLAELAKSRTVTTKGKKRVVSTSSARALIEEKENEPEQEGLDKATKTLGRTSSIRAKVGSVKSRVVNTVRGAPSGRGRTIRPVSA